VRHWVVDGRCCNMRKIDLLRKTEGTVFPVAENRKVREQQGDEPRAILQNRPTQRAPDGWESPRFGAVCVAWSWFRQSGVVSSRPPAGNAHR
jgi:hypothetical protein